MKNRPMNYVDVLGSRMAYAESGTGPTAVFLHGNPTSSYIWRDIIPHVAPRARCIAPDLIGMGQSDKPDLAYRIEDHARYLEAFIEALGLRDVVLVVQDWGSALGLDWARRHEERVRGVAMMEPILPAATWLDFNRAGAELFKAFRSPEGRRLLVDQNMFVEEVLPRGVVRTLTDVEMTAYRAPFLDPAAREPVYRFPNELPIAGAPADTWAMACAYRDWLFETEVPKLFFWAEPGALVSPTAARRLQARLTACTTVPLGQGRHYLQEDHAATIGDAVAKWLRDTVERSA